MSALVQIPVKKLAELEMAAQVNGLLMDELEALKKREEQYRKALERIKKELSRFEGNVYQKEVVNSALKIIEAALS